MIKNLSEEEKAIRRKQYEERRKKNAQAYNDRKSKMKSATTEDIKTLQEILVDDIVKFLKINNIGDIETVSFSVDRLQDSVDFGEWCPVSDSSISCEGIHFAEDNNFIGEMYHIGDYC